jgi:hypothetical protein
MRLGPWISTAQVHFSKKTPNRTGLANGSTKRREAHLNRNTRTDRACFGPVHNGLNSERGDICLPPAADNRRVGTSLACAA